MWWHRLPRMEQHVTYSGSDLDDAAGNQMTQFTKLVDVSGSSTASMPLPMRSPDIG